MNNAIYSTGPEASTTDREVGAQDTSVAGKHQRTMDDEQSIAAQYELQTRWADQFIPNLKKIEAYLDALPGGAGDVFRAARGQHGRLLVNDPAILIRVLADAEGTKQ